MKDAEIYAQQLGGECNEASRCTHEMLRYIQDDKFADDLINSCIMLISL